MRLIALQAAGFICLMIGLLTLPLPLPTGALLLALGIGLLLISSHRAVRLVRRLRFSYPRIDSILTRLQPSLPEPFKAALEKTRIRDRLRIAWAKRKAYLKRRIRSRAVRIAKD